MEVKDFPCVWHIVRINKCCHYLFSSSPTGFLLTPTFYDSKNHLVTDCTNRDEQNQQVLTYLDLKTWCVFSPFHSSLSCHNYFIHALRYPLLTLILLSKRSHLFHRHRILVILDKSNVVVLLLLFLGKTDTYKYGRSECQTFYQSVFVAATADTWGQPVRTNPQPWMRPQPSITLCTSNDWFEDLVLVNFRADI